MRAGRLDRRITVQTRATTRSGSGAIGEAWTTLGSARRPASVALAKGDERLRERQDVASQDWEFRVRYSEQLAALTPLSRIIYPALSDAEAGDSEFVPSDQRIYDVQSVAEIGRREGQTILTRRRTDTP